MVGEQYQNAHRLDQDFTYYLRCFEVFYFEDGSKRKLWLKAKYTNKAILINCDRYSKRRISLNINDVRVMEE